ncbi:hypothetical protein EON82_23615, partial [bacterium]
MISMILPLLPILLPDAHWFIFLVRADGPRPKETAALQEMQKAHIGNLEKLYAEGKFVAAGPVNDPTKHRRGIVVAGAGTLKEVMACFEGDPYVENRIMRVEAHRWVTPPKGFTAPPDVAKMAEYRIARIALPAGYKGAFPSLPGGVGGKFAGENLGVILVSSTDEAAIRRTLDASE